MQTCHYAVIRFLPYRESGEFVNTGVVLFCREAGYFDAILETQTGRRVMDFFPALDRNTYMTGRQAFHEELLRVKALICDNRCRLDMDTRTGVFRELVRPRESVFRFGEIGTVLTEDPARKLTELFELLVNRQINRGGDDGVHAVASFKLEGGEQNAPQAQPA